MRLPYDALHTRQPSCLAAVETGCCTPMMILRPYRRVIVAACSVLAGCHSRSLATPASDAVNSGPPPIALLLVIQSDLFASASLATVDDRQPLLPLGATLPRLTRLEGVTAVFTYGRLAGPRTTFAPLSNVARTWSAGLFDTDGELAFGLRGSLALVPHLMRALPSGMRKIVLVVGDGCDSLDGADSILPDPFPALATIAVELLEIRTPSPIGRDCDLLAGHATRLGTDLATGLEHLPNALRTSVRLPRSERPRHVNTTREPFARRRCPLQGSKEPNDV
jgi:hypothetical protein